MFIICKHICTYMYLHSQGAHPSPRKTRRQSRSGAASSNPISTDAPPPDIASMLNSDVIVISDDDE